jgi:very-short-patch-repair endonuclease
MSRFSVVESVRHLTEQYRSFIKSSYRLADPHLRRQFEAHVNDADVLVKGPYVTLSRDFEAGPALTEMLRNGVGHADLARLNWPFGRSNLFEHQATALRAVEAGRNVIVKTGTGSGKTEAFLLPVLSGILRMKAQGIQGTKAILLYPMNALANDQLQRLREIIRDSATGISFALYTGDSESVVRTLGDPVEDHELISKEDIRRTPPDLILTNYKQLEFLLVRKADRTLFTPALRYVVLDEIHSYRGALATELACLLRRLKARCELHPGELRAIGTSATVSQDAGGDAALARFATDLFAEAFSAADIVGEAYVPVGTPASTYIPPLDEPDDAELAEFSHEDEAALLRFSEQLTGREAPASGSTHARINAMLDGNAVVQALRIAAGIPRTLSELAAAVTQALGGESVVGEKLIAAYLQLASFGDDTEGPLLRPKLHTFFHGVYDVGLCMNPGCRKLIAGGAESCPDCGSAVRPAVLCRTCGQDFVKVRFEPDAPEQTVANEDFLSDDHTAFITPALVGERDDEADDAADSDADEASPQARTRIARGSRTGAARAQMIQQWVDHGTGRVFGERPDDVPSENLSLQHVLRRRGTTCPVCNSRYTRGDVLSLLRTGVASSVSVLSTHHLDEIPEDQRKLLVFADNRQDAAHQAGYMSDRQRQFALRHAIETVVRNAGENGIALQDLHSPVLEVFHKIGLAKRRLTRDEEAQWRKTIEYEVAGEFCRSSQQRISLENLALIEVEYEFLDQLIGEPKFVAVCRRASRTPQEGGLLVRAILDFIRRRRAVSFDFYQRYLDARRQPWSWLTAEPYNLSVSEHEKGATVFMFDRPEALRSRPVSGIKFDALVKDTERGAAGGVFRLLTAKANMDAAVADAWIRNVIELMAEKEMLESPALLPEMVHKHMGTRKALQIAKRIIRLRPAAKGWRCQRCSIWRPYLGGACYASASCSGQAADLKPSEADRDNYYVNLYTADRPRRMKVLEHTAQIDQDERAKREQLFKQGQIEALVCSPTLELGVNIGDLYSVLMRNAPPGPANYVQRAGRAGRRLRIGFVSTFCSTGAHDRHCFEDPAWLVRGEFHPPVVRLSNDKIVARHVRSFALEELNADFSWRMGDLLEDVQNPAELKKDRYQPLLTGLRAGCAESALRAEAIFGLEQGAAKVIETFPDEIEATVQSWHRQVVRLHKEFHEFARIVSTRETEQKRRARMRAYQELTTDRERAFALTYLSEAGLLPSYQFPTDTFSLDPGVGDTPTLRRPAWIALFEFAPGNMVYANGHKLKSIRAFFDGGARSTGGHRGADQSGRVESYCFCGECGFAAAETVNTCPRCGSAIHMQSDIALIDSFEAEENTQITSSEDSRQRLIFDRRENLLGRDDGRVQLYPYEFATLEYQHQAQLLVTNWGRQTRRGQSERFALCPNCGRHKPHGLTPRAQAKWDEDHGRICNGAIRPFVLGYRFSADVLVLPIPDRLAPADEKLANAFCRTLGKALVVGAQEALEIEADEIAYVAHKNGRGGWRIVFYETAPGGAGYLEQLGKDLPRWARASHARLYGHECERACYKCLKSSRNQFDHANLDKELVRGVLFCFQQAQPLEAPRSGHAGDGERIAQMWIEGLAKPQIAQTSDTPIERKLQAAIVERGRLPRPQAQFEVRDDAGHLLTVPDFAYPERRIAIYCDGFAYHANVDALSHDARKRNALQAKGWSVLVFWGRQIQRDPAACEDQIWQCFQFRRAA